MELPTRKALREVSTKVFAVVRVGGVTGTSAVDARMGRRRCENVSPSLPIWTYGLDAYMQFWNCTRSGVWFATVTEVEIFACIVPFAPG